MPPGYGKSRIIYSLLHLLNTLPEREKITAYNVIFCNEMMMKLEEEKLRLLAHRTQVKIELHCVKAGI